MKDIQPEELTVENGWYLLHSFNKVMPNSKKFYFWNSHVRDVVNISMKLIKNRGFIGHVDRNLEIDSKNWAGELIDHYFDKRDDGIVDLYGKVSLSQSGMQALKNPLKGFSMFSSGHTSVINNVSHISLEQIMEFNIVTIRKK